ESELLERQLPANVKDALDVRGLRARAGRQLESPDLLLGERLQVADPDVERNACGLLVDFEEVALQLPGFFQLGQFLLAIGCAFAFWSGAAGADVGFLFGRFETHAR